MQGIQAVQEPMLSRYHADTVTYGVDRKGADFILLTHSLTHSLTHTVMFITTEN